MTGTTYGVKIDFLTNWVSTPSMGAPIKNNNPFCPTKGMLIFKNKPNIKSITKQRISFFSILFSQYFNTKGNKKNINKTNKFAELFDNIKPIKINKEKLARIYDNLILLVKNKIFFLKFVKIRKLVINANKMEINGRINCLSVILKIHPLIEVKIEGLLIEMNNKIVEIKNKRFLIEVLSFMN